MVLSVKKRSEHLIKNDLKNKSTPVELSVIKSDTIAAGFDVVIRNIVGKFPLVFRGKKLKYFKSHIFKSVCSL